MEKWTLNSCQPLKRNQSSSIELSLLTWQVACLGMHTNTYSIGIMWNLPWVIFCIYNTILCIESLRFNAKEFSNPPLGWMLRVEKHLQMIQGQLLLVWNCSIKKGEHYMYILLLLICLMLFLVSYFL